ncbi:DUF5991 domain-containing protein [Teredinibacter haidensis]|uniref:DUF5991 domain-containing protein n=1 Tax=Teredinibacter haidensis TaxID=2731755 RepID=UPI000A97D60E|nr:DUF5991 domain-containing protein [Teredinibacter haidensis]
MLPKGYVCEAKPKVESVVINFFSYSDESVKNKYGVQVYKSGEALLEFTGDTKQPHTVWRSLYSGEVNGSDANCFVLA